MSYHIKFGTDGWRAIIAKDFTTDNLKRVSKATAEWLLKSDLPNRIVIGHDCRFAGRLFLETASVIYAEHGIEVIYADGAVSTPMVSMAAKNYDAGLGIVITASHNPPSYNGYKVKAHYGGPASPQVIQEIEDLILEEVPSTKGSFSEHCASGIIRSEDFQALYEEAVRSYFDVEGLNQSELNFAYDAMYGAGQDVMRNLFPDMTFLHCEENPGFDGQAPEPIHRNLQELSELIRISGDIASGLATDGDADRIGLYDSKGNFIDSHHIILLLIRFLVEEKGQGGKVVTSFSCSSRIAKLCTHYGLEQVVTKIGFKYICDIMVQEDVLLGGEESGGIAVKGHIPERDGIWMGLIIWQYMLRSGKSLEELIKDVYQITGPFALDRYDLHIDEALKQRVIEKCKSGGFQSFGTYSIEKTEDTDGWKYHLGKERYLMIRPSGTEPVLRVYAEAENIETVIDILDRAKETIMAL